MNELSCLHGSERYEVREDEAGFGEGTTQQDLPKGQNRRYADFGTVVESCSKKVTLPAASTNTTIPAGRSGFSGFH